MDNEQKAKSNLEGRRLALMAVAGAAVLLLAGFVIARYMMHQSKSGIVSAQDFYFTSNFLMDSQKDYYIDPRAGSFEIQLYNFADSERVTTEDIKYTVSVSSDGSANKKEGTLKKGSKSTDTVTITPKEGADEITVTVQSTAPYEKKLAATFYLQTGNSYTLENEEGDTAAVLSMICTDYPAGRMATLKLPEGVIPDATDDSVSYLDGTFIYTFPDNGIYSVVLLKSDAGMTGEVTTHTIFSDVIDLRGILH